MGLEKERTPPRLTQAIVGTWAKKEVGRGGKKRSKDEATMKIPINCSTPPARRERSCEIGRGKRQK